MKEYIKTYVMGLLVVAVLLHPLLIAKLLGMQMSKSGDIGAAYFSCVVLEIFGMMIIALPFLFGKIAQKSIKDTRKTKRSK